MESEDEFLLSQMNGDGSKENPYEIRNEQELYSIRHNTLAHYTLKESIELQTDNSLTFVQFEGVLDGNNNGIKTYLKNVFYFVIKERLKT